MSKFQLQPADSNIFSLVVVISLTCQWFINSLNVYIFFCLVSKCSTNMISVVYMYMPLKSNDSIMILIVISLFQVWQFWLIKKIIAGCPSSIDQQLLILNHTKQLFFCWASQPQDINMIPLVKIFVLV